MFLGHYGIGLAAKKPAKSISLGTFFLAAQWIDLIWPILVLLNIEQVVIQPGDTKLTPLEFIHYPYSHSLLFVLVWGIVLGGVYFLIKKNKRNALIVGLLVLSHWILDLIVHKPDLPLVPGGPYLGLGLWNIPLIAVILEFIIYIGGVILYVNTTTPKDKVSKYGFWSLIILLAVIYIVNIAGPPPPDVDAIGWAGLLLWLFVLWAYWIDRHRIIRE
jgi:FtsH-binding integral membrane protein